MREWTAKQRRSIANKRKRPGQGPSGRNKDEAGGDQVYNKKGMGTYGPKRTRSTRGDETDY